MAKINVTELLATSLGRRDEEPNVELAQKVVAAKDKAAVKELVTLLDDKKKDIRQDCIKTLYEIGYLQPSLIKDYLGVFLQQLKSKNNRMVWGAMTAIDSIAAVASAEVYRSLPEILDAGEKGSVITKDHVLGTLVKLAEDKKLAKDIYPLLFEQLQKAAPNQFPMYAENTLSVIGAGQKEQFADILNARLVDLPKDSQKKRINKVLKKLG